MLALFLRDIRLSIRAGGGALTGVIFFLAVIATIPFGVGPDLNREDGSLDLLVLGNDRQMLALTVLTKCLAHWAGSVLPLVIAAPLLGLFMNMEPIGIGATALTLLVGTPAITFIGAAGAAVAVA
ncbi:MAG: heme exporter protein CcmB, partial [Mesorhizobium sp.]